MHNVLYVEQNQDGTVGGSYWCLYYILKNIDRREVIPYVMFYQDHKLMDKYNEIGIDSDIYDKPLAKRRIDSNNFVAKIFNSLLNLVTTDIIPAVHFYRYLKSHKIDIVHLNNTCQGGMSWNLACHFARVPCITHQRVYTSDFTELERINANKFHNILCITNEIRRSLILKKIHSPTTVLYDALDISNYHERILRSPEDVRSEYCLNEKDILIVLVGNFIEWKGQSVAVEAIALLKKRGLYNYKLLLVGDYSDIINIGSDYHDLLNTLINENQLHEHVIKTGYREDVPDIVNAADIVVHTSISPEPFGMVVVEAMSIGKVVISTNIGGPKEIIDDGLNGILIEPAQPEKLANCIVNTLNDRSLMEKISNNASKKVRDKFSIYSQVRDLEAIYRKTLDEYK